MNGAARASPPCRASIPTPGGEIAANQQAAALLVALVAASGRGFEDLCKHLAILTRRVEAVSKDNPVCRRLMTAPGVGPIIALSFVTAVDNPLRFSNDEDIGAYFGLTPKQHQSGETDYQEGISRLGNSMTRVHLVQAATILLSSSRKWSTLKAWGMKVAKRRGFNKARIAVARKLAIILHRMWINEQDFRWSNKTEESELDRSAAA